MSKTKKEEVIPHRTKIEMLYGITKDEYIAGLNTKAMKERSNKKLQSKIDKFVENGRRDRSLGAIYC